MLGSGSGGGFSLRPDWHQWAVMVVFSEDERPDDHLHFLKKYLGNYIPAYWRFFHCNVHSFLLEPLEGHGLWSGKKCFGNLPKNSGYEGKIAVLTRATIRLSRLRNFWKQVAGVNAQMLEAEGYIRSFGIGEIPAIKQATFSIWQSKAAMTQFAYRRHAHQDVIQKTRRENWYREEMFVRFRILQEWEEKL